LAKVVAFVLIVADIGKEHDIISQLKKIKGVIEPRTVYGEFDVIARIETDDMHSLDEVVTKVRKISSVIRTVTLISS